MTEAEQFRLRRDRALRAWRTEAQRLSELSKSPSPLAGDLEHQKKAVGQARELYDSLNEEYLNYIQGAKLNGVSTANRLVH